MCKNLIVVGSVGGQILWDFLIAAQEGMCNMDKDGLGYAAMDKQGELWGEKWLYPSDGWKYRPNNADSKIAKKLRHLTSAKRYDKFGLAEPDKSPSVLYHSRHATCDKNITNTHPFVRKGVALIHNGVINNHFNLKKISSTCDSEVILNEYFEQDVMNNPEKIKDVANSLYGYYACGVLGSTSSGTRYVDVFRNPTASLYVMYVGTLEALVFCTRKEIVEDACKKLKWECSSAYEVESDSMLRLDALTGDMIGQYSFKSNANYYRHQSHIQQDEDEKKKTHRIGMS
jgi:hypothetical protein